jgi:hypothetical protein
VIGATPLTIAAPAGYRYARTAETAIAEHPEGSALLGALAAGDGSPDAALAAIDALAKTLGISEIDPKPLKKRLKKPQEERDLDGIKLALWEVTSAQQKKAPAIAKGPGTLLVGLAKTGDTSVVFLGFVVEPDERSAAEEIMTALTSLKVGE